MSAALLAYIFVNFPLNLPHTNRCYPHCASSQKSFVSSIHQKERIRPTVEYKGRRKGIITPEVCFDKCSNFVQLSTDNTILEFVKKDFKKTLWDYR